jgi:hypothetical protein
MANTPNLSDYDVKITIITEVYDKQGILVHTQTQQVDQAGEDIDKKFKQIMQSGIVK